MNGKSTGRYKLGVLVTHPIQYYVPWYKALAANNQIDLKVYFCYQQTSRGQAEAGFGVEFDWNLPLLEGYRYQFLENKAKYPNVSTFFGCDTPEIKEIIKNNKFDAFIVQGWNNKSYWQAIKVCWRQNIPLMIRGDSYLETNNLLKRVMKYFVYRWFVPKFDAYLAPGKRAREYYLHYGANLEKIYFVPHTVDNDFFARKQMQLQSQREKLRQNWKIPEKAVVFLFAGKLIAKKRPDDFMKAVKLASKKNQLVFGLVVGDGPLREGLAKKASEERIPIRFTGFLNQNEISKAYAVSDCIVLPSGVGETWGLVVNEAMASLLPAIVSDKVGCGPDLIYPGQTGVIFRCGDVIKLSEIILELSLNPVGLKEMGKNAREKIKDYSVKKAAKNAFKAVKFTCQDIS